MASWPKNDRNVADLTPRQHAERVKECMDWMRRNPDAVTREFPRRGFMTAKEINVVIGWDEWPEKWPKVV